MYMLHDTYKPTVSVGSPNRVGYYFIFFHCVSQRPDGGRKNHNIGIRQITLISPSLFSSRLRDGHVGRYGHM